jgi:hypothetical protein
MDDLMVIARGGMCEVTLIKQGYREASQGRIPGYTSPVDTPTDDDNIIRLLL